MKTLDRLQKILANILLKTSSEVELMAVKSPEFLKNSGLFVYFSDINYGQISPVILLNSSTSEQCFQPCRIFILKGWHRALLIVQHHR